MNHNLFETLKKMTDGYPLSPVDNESEEAAESEKRDIRLKALITQVRQMGIRKFYQMPESFRETHTKEDWIQDALILLFNQIRAYDPDKGTFSHFVRFMVSRGLIDIQRRIFRENPPVNEDVRKLAVSFRRENGREPTPKELSDISGRSIEDVSIFLQEGVGERVCISLEEAPQSEDIQIGKTPERLYIEAEAKKILHGCMDQLHPELKVLFIRKEFDSRSFRELFEEKCFSEALESDSQRSFQRHYVRKVYDKVKKCVTDQYRRMRGDK